MWGNKYPVRSKSERDREIGPYMQEVQLILIILCFFPNAEIAGPSRILETK